MTLPLEGIKVVDMTQIVMGPTCTRNLADQGADVIKVEPFQGDDYRNRYTSPRLASHNLSRPFLALNRNKRSIVVDISKGKGREVVHRLGYFFEPISWAKPCSPFLPSRFFYGRLNPPSLRFPVTTPPVSGE